MTDPSRPDREMAAGVPDPEPVRTTDYAGDLGCWSLLVVVLLAWWLA